MACMAVHFSERPALKVREPRQKAFSPFDSHGCQCGSIAPLPVFAERIIKAASYRGGCLWLFLIEGCDGFAGAYINLQSTQNALFVRGVKLFRPPKSHSLNGGAFLPHPVCHIRRKETASALRQQEVRQNPYRLSGSRYKAPCPPQQWAAFPF